MILRSKFSWILVVLLSFPGALFAAQYETTVVDSPSSFDVLNDDPILPKEKVRGDLEQELTRTFERDFAFPSQNYGYPSGSFGSAMGGRTIDDAQVTTLGVPLALPQGGGVDFSQFPGYLWSGYDFSPAPTQGGSTPQAASGSLDLKVWTREMVRPPFVSDSVGQVSTAVDQQTQSVAVGSAVKDTAVMVGNSFGDLSGPAGSLSHTLVQNGQQQVVADILFSSLQGADFGSLQFPTPLGTKTTWRILPVVETAFRLNEHTSFQSTLFADLSSLDTSEPGVLTSASRTWQYGIENALKLGNYTLGASARFVMYDASTESLPSATVTQIHRQEWPLHLSVTRNDQWNPEWSTLAGVQGDYLVSSGGDSVSRQSDSGLGGRVGVRYQASRENAFFSEAQTLEKIPTLAERYYPGFADPTLAPERVTFIILGHEANLAKSSAPMLKIATTVKLEERNQVQLPNANFVVINSGTAYLTSVTEEVNWQANAVFLLGNKTVFTQSKIAATGYSYPDLPVWSDRFKVQARGGDWVTAHFYANLTGSSTQYSGADHPGYALYDVELSRSLKWKSSWIKTVEAKAGILNLLDNRAQMVAGYPLPGRMITAALTARLY